jgi:hypothetical protein
MTTTIDYHADAIERLEKVGGKAKIKYFGYDSPPWDSETKRNHYKVTLSSPSGRYTFDFWDSIRATEQGTEPNEYAALSCLEWYVANTFEEFCSDCGYSTDSRAAERVFKAVRRQYKGLYRVFPNEADREIMAEIR